MVICTGHSPEAVLTGRMVLKDLKPAYTSDSSPKRPRLEFCLCIIQTVENTLILNAFSLKKNRQL